MVPSKDREEHEREMAERAAAVTPADLTAFELPESLDADDRLTFAKGITAFREGDFYLAHDLWEEVWHGYRLRDRRFLQGLIQIAVGAFHAQSANFRGSSSQLGMAIDKLTPYRPRFWGIDTDRLLERVARLREQQADAPAIDVYLKAVCSGL